MRGCSGMRRRGAARLPGQKTACLTPRKEDGFCPPNLETRVRRAAEFKRNTRPPPVLRRDVVGFIALDGGLELLLLEKR